jgi:hypothetical protein
MMPLRDQGPIAVCRRVAELLDVLADALERDVDADRVDDAMNAVAAALQRVGNSFPPVVHWSGPSRDVSSSERKKPRTGGASLI